MTVSIKPMMTGKLDGRTGGKGAKIVLAIVQMDNAAAEALHPNVKWLDMKSIKAVFPMNGPNFASAFIQVNVVAPGSVGNYCSFVLRNPRIDSTIVSIGTVLDTPNGSVNMPMLIVGE